MNLFQLQFDHVQFIWLLLLLFLIIFSFISLYNYRKKRVQEFAQPDIASTLLTARTPSIFWIKSFLFCLAWTGIVIALMGPKGNERYFGTVERPQNSVPQKKNLRKRADQVIFLFDASASMKVKDVPGGKERVNAAKEIAQQIIERLKGENVALYAFTSETIALVPLTTDYFFTRLMLQQLKINESETQGTDFRQVLTEINKLFLNNTMPVVKSLILLSDGGDTSLIGLSGVEKIKAVDQIVQVLDPSDKKNFHLYAVGIGSHKGADIPGIMFKGKPVHSELEEQLLRKLGSHGGGNYFSIEKENPSTIAQAISEAIEKEQTYASDTGLSFAASAQNAIIFDYYFFLPLSIAILALMLILILPDTQKKLLIAAFYLISFNALSAQIEKLDQKMILGENFYEAEEYQSALNQYADLLDYPLSTWEYALIKYNMGTVLLRSKKWNDALLYFLSLQGEEIPLQLEADLTRNIALAYLGMIQQQIPSLIKIEDVSIFEQINSLFLQFQIEFESAVQTACRLSKSIGNKDCVLPIEFDKIDQEATHQFTRFIELLTSFQGTSLQKQVTAQDSPENLLKRAIAAQEEAQQFVQFEKVYKNNSAGPMILQSQKNVSHVASQFLRGVVQTEKQQFLSEETTSHCQREPWDQVLPLFFEGKKQAEKASYLLSKQSDLLPVLRAQKDALLKWQEALEKLQQLKQETEKEQKPDYSSSMQSQKQSDINTQEMLRTLQQMEEDDRSQPQTVINPSKAEVERPW